MGALSHIELYNYGGFGMHGALKIWGLWWVWSFVNMGALAYMKLYKYGGYGVHGAL